MKINMANKDDNILISLQHRMIFIVFTNGKKNLYKLSSDQGIDRVGGGVSLTIDIVRR